MPPYARFFFALAFFPAPLAAEEIARDSGASLQRLAENVYLIVHDDATDEWPHGNTGIVVYDDGVFVLDSAYLPSRAKKDIALIRKATKKPVRYLATTHWHFDHNNGAVAYREAFPDLVVIAERETDDFIDINSSYWPRLSTTEGSTRLKSLADLEAEMKTGKNADGADISADRLAALPEIIERRKAELSELKSLEIVNADIMFEKSLSLRLGDRTIELVDRGKANSPHDVTVYLPEERILFAGDIVVQSPLPYVGASWPKQWIEVLSAIESENVAILAPGHGPAMSDLSYVKKLRTTFKAVLERVEALVRAGRTLDQVQAEIALDDLRENYPLWNEGVSDEDWKYIKTTLVERAFRGVRGAG